ncbi:class I SAM-dependent rRNA methyltransferase [Enterococcus italicus]|uniref:Uncharacterized protein n=1 Tax=Enterococcus italicus (strain DSM 15952 / CCUG 50447 / LMG 22039 / TP 1.5) TaxID=888064 RepID=E6LCD8_ENTI1|nr:class I SAM-dependent rRNA methyltransferase [Enterococcus italicus]EFU75116.1 hypothetical protein HMPREF9088_0028 [Enterococcus italicus DSM 15952]OJG58438.1 SAM-dependent methyltransferase [Enterococcus italicus DSM 15952]HCS29925.1 class I SAM-dependent rRNA methyltransferase [Enterococcus sp.]
MRVTITKKAEKKLRQGFPLVQKEDLVDSDFPTDWVIFQTQRKEEIARGYLGKQNKGVGWVLTQKKVELDESFFEAIFLKAKASRQSYFNRSDTTAFRILNGEGDSFGGLTIDWYAGYVVFSWYNETLYTHKDELVRAFQTAYPEVKGAYEKIRFASDLPESMPIYGERAPEPLLIKENGITYATYLNEGLMTGIFLDQREVRGKLASGFLKGKSILNMFSYTGAFSVAAAVGGAGETTSVDLANRSLELTKEQFQVNHLSSEEQHIYVMDTFEYFKYAKRKNLSYDCIVLDPPSFARNKKKVFTVAKNYGELIEQSLDILAPNGWLVASTNAANVSLEKFEKQIEQAIAKKGVKVRKQTSFALPSDFKTISKFPEGSYLKVLFYQRMD